MLLLMKYGFSSENPHGDNTFRIEPVGIYSNLNEAEDALLRLEMDDLEHHLKDDEYTRALLLDPDPSMPLNHTWPSWTTEFRGPEQSQTIKDYYTPHWQQAGVVWELEVDWRIWDEIEQPPLQDRNQYRGGSRYFLYALNTVPFFLAEAIPDLHD